MNLHPQTYGKVVVLAPQGRINHKVAEHFEAALTPYMERYGCSDRSIVLDLSHVDYMSSSGLRVLMRLAKHCKQQAGTVVVAGMKPTMQEIFEISRFHQLFTTYQTVREALEAIAPEALQQSAGTPPPTGGS